MSDKNATLTSRVIKLEHEVKTIKEDLKGLEHLKEVSIKQSAQYEYIITSLDEIKQQVKEISTKPSKYWDGIIIAVVTAVITLIVSHFTHF